MFIFSSKFRIHWEIRLRTDRWLSKYQLIFRSINLIGECGLALILKSELNQPFTISSFPPAGPESLCWTVFLGKWRSCGAQSLEALYSEERNQRFGACSDPPCNSPFRQAFCRSKRHKWGAKRQGEDGNERSGESLVPTSRPKSNLPVEFYSSSPHLSVFWYRTSLKARIPFALIVSVFFAPGKVLALRKYLLNE